MKVKWLIVGLFVLGLACAAGAAMLVTALRADKPAVRSEALVEVLAAKTALPTMTVIDARDLVTRKVPKSQVPLQAVTNPTHAIGHVLVAEVAADQILTSASFATAGSGRQMATALTNGMRAVTISLPEHSGLEGLLYPGCLVDVIASIHPEKEGKSGDLVSVPLLQRIQVLAVGRQTLFSPEEPSPASPANLRSGSSKRLVTLMVNPEQARALQLASETGSLSLAMRNPFDKDPVNAVPMLINDILPHEPPPGAGAPVAMAKINASSLPDVPAPAPQRQVIVIRGSNVAKQSFVVNE